MRFHSFSHLNCIVWLSHKNMKFTGLDVEILCGVTHVNIFCLLLGIAKWRWNGIPTRTRKIQQKLRKFLSRFLRHMKYYQTVSCVWYHTSVFYIIFCILYFILYYSIVIGGKTLNSIETLYRRPALLESCQSFWQSAINFHVFCLC